MAVLAALNANRDQFLEWCDSGIDFHDSRIIIPSVESDTEASKPPSANDDPLQWYIQTETVSLLHHSLETLFRLYTGLADARHWIDPLVALADRSRDLPDQVRKQVIDITVDDMRSTVSHLLLAQPVADDAPEFVAVVDNLAAILKVLAARWIKNRQSFNAIKHGLLVSQSNAVLSVGPVGEDLVDVGYGPSIAFLTHTNWQKQPVGSNKSEKVRDWSVETHWIRFGESSKILATACVLIDSLWSIAVARWSPSDDAEMRQAFIDPSKFSASDLGANDNDPPALDMTRPVFTEKKPN
ncbi:MAG: hypothetical protein J4G11_10800 [Acidimicrobiia bacterium]|nr:hypothetical protein [Acidimicrobiia bacterium]